MPTKNNSTRRRGGAEKKMSRELQRIQIAQACGWKNVHWYSDNSGPDILCGTPPKGSWQAKQKPYPNEHVLDYLNDLNAIHEAEEVIPDDATRGKYIRALAKVFGCEVATPTFLMIHAKAADRAEALLKALNLWTSSPLRASASPRLKK